MLVFRTVIEHHQDVGVADAIREKIEQRLRFSVDPVKVFEDE
jgi:hypothetical protein